MCRSRNCCSVAGAGASTSRSCPRCVFGNAITSRIDSAPHISVDDAVEAERDAAMRRRAVLQRVEQEAELAPLVFGADAERRENARLHVRLMDTHGAPADLPAVQHDVVGLGERVARIGREAVLVPVLGRGERMMPRAPMRRPPRPARTSGSRRPTTASSPASNRPRSWPMRARSAPSVSLTTFARSAPKKIRSPDRGAGALEDRRAARRRRGT